MRAIPFLEKPKNRASRLQLFHSVVAAQQETTEMSAVDVAHTLRPVVIFGEEERGIGTVAGVVIKQLVDRSQKSSRVLQGNDALTAQIRLQIRHQKGPGNSFSGNVAEHKREPVLTQMKKVIVIATHLAGLNADARIVECFQGWKGLGEESRLHLFSDLQFVGRRGAQIQASPL